MRLYLLSLSPIRTTSYVGTPIRLQLCSQISFLQPTPTRQRLCSASVVGPEAGQSPPPLLISHLIPLLGTFQTPSQPHRTGKLLSTTSSIPTSVTISMVSTSIGNTQVKFPSRETPKAPPIPRTWSSSSKSFDRSSPQVPSYPLPYKTPPLSAQTVNQ